MMTKNELLGDGTWRKKMTMVLEQVKEAAIRTKMKWPGGSDAQKACRAIAAFELGLVELQRLYNYDTALKILDPNRGVKQGERRGKPTMFDVSERHIRRVESIRAKRPLDAARLEGIAMRGAMSLELVEYNINHPPSADALEALWLTTSDEQRAEFMSRIRR
jgi:hypothetical protein